MWLFVAVAVATQSVFGKESTPQQNKTCIRSAVSVKKYGYDKEFKNSSALLGQKDTRVSSNVTLKMETIVVREGNAHPFTVQRLTGWDRNGTVWTTTEILTSDEGKEREYKFLERGSFENYLNSCKETRMHKMSGIYGQNHNSRSGLHASTEPTRVNRNRNRRKQNRKGKQRKQNPNFSSQRYDVPNDQNQQYRPRGNNYGNPYPNAMEQSNNMYGQHRPQNQYNQNPSMQNLAPPYANTRNLGAIIVNQQNNHPNQFNQNPNAQNPAQPNANVGIPIEDIGSFIIIKVAPCKILPDYPNPAPDYSNPDKQVKPGRHGTPIDFSELAANPNNQFASNNNVQSSASQSTFKSIRINPNNGRQYGQKYP